MSSIKKHETVTNSKKNLLLLPLDDISDYVYEQAENNNADEELIEYLNELLCMINCDTEDYFYNAVCEAVEDFTIDYIIQPLKEIGYLLTNTNEIFEDFETQAHLLSKNREEVIALKAVWIEFALQNHEMCDVIRYILIPTFIEQRMTELRSLKKYYLDYREITSYKTNKDVISR